MFSRVLIANRGEVALRVIRACKEMGIETVAVFSEADRNASYLHLADDRICIGEGPSAQSYLNIPRIIAAAEIADVDAIHPGYGFLAENAHFAQICRDCKIEFIGPSIEAMRGVGDKIRAKEMAKVARVPTTPDSEGAIESVDDAVKIAAKIGYPVAIKAAAGGGGRGIRFAHNEASLRGSFKQAQSEAEIAFKDGRLYMEKCIQNFRHIEVQILGDMAGNVVHLFERDCSVQRRNQKLIEETPAPGLSEELRQEVCSSAVRLAKECGYYNAGTVEFMLDSNNKFYFLEVNARIQVEHPITEMVTGVDLVKWQIRVAAGETLPFKQKDLAQTGTSIECRINAEDPDLNFRPSPGPVEAFVAPGGYGVRWDSHVYQGYTIPPTYDSLIGKLIVHRPTRVEAIATAQRALEEFAIHPTKTTVPLCRKILSHEKFARGQWDTQMIERDLLPGPAKVAPPAEK
ncbi:MAG: acetyl-CoA carboxylase biotin carboxylase subunit [Planctomycetaceae bacterium]|nr:acetyl-CoA carboxylase biotin carboxylase subunit [Planctomycetaceae bacterium]